MSFSWNLHTHEVNTYCFYENVFSNEEIDTIVKAGLTNELHKAKVGGQDGKESTNINQRSSSISWLESEEFYWIYRRLTDVILDANDKWFKYELDFIESLQFSVYNKGDFYTKHIDHMYMGYGKTPRKLSFSVQLTDPKEYSGGKTLLYTSDEPFSIPQQKGCITFFPSYVLHEVTEVTEGQRISLVGWIRGPKFK